MNYSHILFKAFNKQCLPINFSLYYFICRKRPLCCHLQTSKKVNKMHIKLFWFERQNRETCPSTLLFFFFKHLGENSQW